MDVEIIQEFGYKSAIIGLSLSFRTTFARAEDKSVGLAKMDHGHNKFLEQIDVWVMVTAPRYWWQEADTYRLTSKQSESTMHTIGKRPLRQEDFESPLPEGMLEIINKEWQRWKDDEITIEKFKNCLPEGFLQTRVWKLNYKNLREIIIQRQNHKLPEWRKFIEAIIKGVQHPELLPEIIGG